MSVDYEVYELMNKLFGLQIKQKVYNPQLAFQGQIDTGTFLLIDEADNILLDHAI